MTRAEEGSAAGEGRALAPRQHGQTRSRVSTFLPDTGADGHLEAAAVQSAPNKDTHDEAVPSHRVCPRPHGPAQDPLQVCLERPYCAPLSHLLDLRSEW